MGTDTDSSRLSITYIAIASLRLNPRNARTHSKRQLRQIGDSIRAFGFLNPIILDDDGMVLAGHGRAEAARLAGLEMVPTLRASGLTEAQKRAYVLADNKLAEKAGWDRELLVAELGDLAVLLPQIDLDLTLTGFEPPEIDILFADRGPARPNPADDLPTPSRTQVNLGNALRTLGEREGGAERLQQAVDVLRLALLEAVQAQDGYSLRSGQRDL